MSPLSRRALLASSVGTVGTLAGCLNGGVPPEDAGFHSDGDRQDGPADDCW